jgi:exopolyphosphatase/guanosine-5'-triphosphate,3'-diphosphate pyrophosphatase
MKLAAIDLGSNTFLCLIAEVQNGRIGKVFHDSVEAVRLGQDLARNKKFHPDAILRADLCLKKFSQIIAEHQPERILAMATSAARDAENREDLFALGKRHNIPIEIIPGEKEAEITYQGAVSGLAQSSKGRMVIDIGGGSTEFIFGQGLHLLQGTSFDIGCVRLTEKFISAQPTPDADLAAATEYISAYLEKAKSLMPENFTLEEILAVAGTPTTLAAADIGEYIPEKIDGYRLDQKKLQNWLLKLQRASVEEKIVMKIPPGRADVILIGVVTLLKTLEIFNLNEFTVSTRGVRYGVALELAARA